MHTDHEERKIPLRCTLFKFFILYLNIIYFYVIYAKITFSYCWKDEPLLVCT